MSLAPLQEGLVDLDGFTRLGHYRLFGSAFLDYVQSHRPTLIRSPSDSRYRFYQYGEPYRHAITRPLNADLWIEQPSAFEAAFDRMLDALAETDRQRGAATARYAASGEMRRVLYTAQQAAGCVADSLGNSNRARKRVGQVFERLVLLLVQHAGLDCEPRTVVLPIPDHEGHTMKYELDFVFSRRGAILTGEQPILPGEVVGSVKTTSKDRIDKVFLDKQMLSRLLGRDVPVVAVFLHDVQRARRDGLHLRRRLHVQARSLPGVQCRARGPRRGLLRGSPPRDGAGRRALIPDLRRRAPASPRPVDADRLTPPAAGGPRRRRPT